MAQQIGQDRRMLDTQSGMSASYTDQMIDTLSRSSRYAALLVAWVAMCGSLFFSEVLGWVPCVLCWYQRILMYPLALIIAVGLLRRDRGLHLYVLPFSLLGASVSLYHYLLVKTDWLPPPPCSAGVSCTVDYLNWFGFVNIPFLALTAFLIITFMAVASAVEPAPADMDDVSDIDDTSNVGRQPLRMPTFVAVFGIIGVVVTAFVVAARFV